MTLNDWNVYQLSLGFQRVDGKDLETWGIQHWPSSLDSSCEKCLENFKARSPDLRKDHTWIYDCILIVEDCKQAFCTTSRHFIDDVKPCKATPYSTKEEFELISALNIVKN